MSLNTLPPPETFSFGYSSLFQVRVLHHYFLDIGTDAFNAAAPTPAQAAALQAYDMRRFWRIVPSPATQELLRRQRLRFYSTADGFQVLAEGQKVSRGAPGTPRVFSLRVLLDETADFSFLIYPTDPDFLRYTRIPDDSLALVPSPPLEIEPLGRMLLLYNANQAPAEGESPTADRPILAGATLKPTDTAPYHALVKGMGGTPLARPLGVLLIRHGNPANGRFPDQPSDTVQLVTSGYGPVLKDEAPETGAPEHYAKGLKYTLELPTRRTAWVYQKPNQAPVVLKSWYPLTLHGRIGVRTNGNDPNSPKVPDAAMNTTRPYQETDADLFSLPEDKPADEPAYISFIY